MTVANVKSGGPSVTTPTSADVTGTQACPVCESSHSWFYARIDGYDYFRCEGCGSLHIDSSTLNAIDAGHSTRVYDADYWAEELSAARERAAGESLVRCGEAILYARRAVHRFLDVGAGPGYLLDALAERFPSCRNVFYGVELFPPEERSSHPNYLVGSAGDLDGQFDAGVCIEVAEHLTPHMLDNLAGELAKVSAAGTLWLFNTGMPELVMKSDPGYLDPLRRGHIVSYGLAGIKHIFEPHGFRITQVPGKNYAWVAEFAVDERRPDFEGRLSRPVSENLNLLMRAPLVYQAAIESARGSLNLSLMEQRSRWAISIENELASARALYSSLQIEHNNVAKWAHSLRDDLAAVSQRHVALQVEHEGVAKWAHSLRDDLAAVSQRHVALQAEHERVTDLVQALEQRLNELQRHDLALETDYIRIINSRSWKLTRPLRWISARLGLGKDKSPFVGEHG